MEEDASAPIEGAPSAQSQSSAPAERTRRMTACFPCQKQKVRCQTEPGHSSCRRCEKRSIACVSKKDISARSQNSSFRAAAIHDLKHIHAAINELRAANGQEPLDSLRCLSDLPSVNDLESVGSPNGQNADQPTLDAEMLDGPSAHASRAQSPSHAPITSLYQITRLRSLRSKHLPVYRGGDTSRESKDLISRGALSAADADRLIQSYLAKPDYYLYGIGSKFKDLDSIRRASSLLLVAICAVSALHDSGGRYLYAVCNTELRKLVSNFVFTSKVNLEDFRGLCIACFWISDIAWPVSGLAIRRAVEFDLQQSFNVIKSGASGNPSSSGHTRGEAIECMRLWYLFCICDQHLSILYGRPSTIEAQDSVNDWETYLNEVQDENLQSQNTDVRIMSQFALLKILIKVTQLFGRNLNQRVPTIFAPQLEDYIHQLDLWVASWLGRYHPHPVVAEYPRKAVTIHFYFAKLFVCSHAFRGLTSDAQTDPMPPPFKEIAIIAVNSAKSVVTLITQDPDMKDAFVGLPHYFHTMIAFACSFLLKITTKYRGHMRIEAQPIFDMINQVVVLCKSTASPHHLMHWMGEGLQSLLTTCMTATANVERREQQQQMESARRMSQTSNVGGMQGVPMAPPNQSVTYPQPEGSYLDIWDTAREAAMVFPGERSDEFYGLTPEALYTAQGGLPLDGSVNAWDAPLAFFDVEHMGFGLL